MPKLPTPRMKKYAQYALLFEHPSQVTASEEQPGRYWKNYKENKTYWQSLNDVFFTGRMQHAKNGFSPVWFLLAVLLALFLRFIRVNSQVIDLATGAGISKMLRYENAQVYLFGETHRCTEYQQFRNALFQYLVKEKGFVFL